MRYVGIGGIGGICILIVALLVGRLPKTVYTSEVYRRDAKDVTIQANTCPTGHPCGATAPYCRNYSAPSTKGAISIRFLPYRITSPGKYYLDSDLSSGTIGIAVLADDVDINLNGHTITFGTNPVQSGASSAAEYGVLLCDTGNLVSEDLDPIYKINGYCKNGLASRNVTVENGTIIQSPNAPQYYDPANCPGSGPANGCSHHHESIASDVINFQYTSGIVVKHMTLAWQNADSDGIHMAWQFKGPGDAIECNTFVDKVTQINVRSYQRGIPINGQNASLADHADTIQFNTLLGSPQSGIVVGAPGTRIQNNDISQGYYQFPPFTSAGRMYSNDYAIGSCVRGGTIAYNYVHSVSGRGIGCIFGGDMRGMTVHDNYLDMTEQNANGEYGPNGEKPGADWIAGCEINGGRGFESKESPNIQLYNNTFILRVNPCGGGGTVFAQFPCREVRCPDSTGSFDVHDNKINVRNVGSSSAIPSYQAVACYILTTVDGAAGGYFSKPFARDDCTTDGDYIQSDGYGPGRNLQWVGGKFTKGSNPLVSVMNNSAGLLLHWSGQEPPPSDERGYVIQDFSFANGAGLTFAQDGTHLERTATVQWTYTPTVTSSADGNPVRGASVSVADRDGAGPSCKTDERGQCSIVLRQQTVASAVGQSLSVNVLNPNAVKIVAPGCETLLYNLTISRVSQDTRTLNCH